MSTIALSPSIQRRITTTLFTTQSLFGAALIATFALTSIVAARLSGLESWAGFPATLVLVGRALSAYPIGWLMDRAGRRTGFVVGYLLGGVGALLSAHAIVHLSFWEFCAGATMLGMGRGVSEQARYAAAELYPTAQRARVIGLIVWAGTIGSITGPLLVDPSSHLATRFGLDPYTGPFLAAAVMAFAAMILTSLYLRPDPLLLGRQLSVDEPAEQPQAPARSVREIFANNTLRLAVAAMAIGQLVMTLIMVITPLHMSHHSHGIGAISWVLMAHTLGMFGVAIITGWLIDRFGQVSMIGLGGLILAFASAMAPLSTHMLMLALALFLLGLGWNFCFTAGSSLLANALSPNERGRVQGFSDTLVALASATSSLGTGFAFAYGGIILVSAIGLACSLIFLAATFWSTWRRDPASATALH